MSNKPEMLLTQETTAGIDLDALAMILSGIRVGERVIPFSKIEWIGYELPDQDEIVDSEEEVTDRDAPEIELLPMLMLSMDSGERLFFDADEEAEMNTAVQAYFKMMSTMARLQQENAALREELRKQTAERIITPSGGKGRG